MRACVYTRPLAEGYESGEVAIVAKGNQANQEAGELTSPLGGFLGNFLMPLAAGSAPAPSAGVVTFFAGPATFDILTPL